LFVADFRAAGDLRHSPAEGSLAPEAAGDDFAKLPVAPARVELWAVMAGLTKEQTKLEGLAIVAPDEIALANDNDFGLGANQHGTPSFVWLLRLPRALPQAR